MKLLYLANIRMPTEKAHGLQIVQMCEAFAQAGAEVTLVVPRRFNTPEMDAVEDIWAYYGVECRFSLIRIPCLDLFPFGVRFEKFAFPLQALTFTLMLMLWLLTQRADVYYTRDPFILFALNLIKPRRTRCYEVHQVSKSAIGRKLQDIAVRRSGTVIAVTGKLASELAQRASPKKNILVAHDGFQSTRFANLPDRAEARRILNLPTDAFIIGYSGRLHTLMLSKGIDKLIDAIALLRDYPMYLCLVGGPDNIAESLRQQWVNCGLPLERFLFQGYVNPNIVPMYIAAFDVCAMPSPDEPFFRYYASPLKLFEYMAAGGTILSSDLPAVAEVLRHEDNALLVPPNNIATLADALKRLYDNPPLRSQLGKNALQDSQHYSWRGRAEFILNTICEDR